MLPVLYKHQLHLVISLIPLAEQVLWLHCKAHMHTPFGLLWHWQHFIDLLCITVPLRLGERRKNFLLQSAVSGEALSHKQHLNLLAYFMAENIWIILYKHTSVQCKHTFSPRLWVPPSHFTRTLTEGRRGASFIFGAKRANVICYHFHISGLKCSKTTSL